MHIDLLFDILRENGRRVFSPGFSESFDAIIGRTREYLAACRAAEPRDSRTERDLGANWLASASFSSSEPDFSKVCHQVGVALCRADLKAAPSVFERAITDMLVTKVLGENRWADTSV